MKVFVAEASGVIGLPAWLGRLLAASRDSIHAVAVEARVYRHHFLYLGSRETALSESLSED